MMKLLRRFFFIAVCLTGASLLFTGCVSQAPAPVQQQVSIAQAPPPPSPPSKEELEKPPNIVLEKPARDPFIPLSGEGAVAAQPPTAKGKGGKAPAAGASSEAYVVSGVLVDGNSSAIIQAGTNSYIVHQGDHLGGYRVASITTRGVVLVGKGGKLSLPLSTNQ